MDQQSDKIQENNIVEYVLGPTAVSGSGASYLDFPFVIWADPLNITVYWNIFRRQTRQTNSSREIGV